MLSTRQPLLLLLLVLVAAVVAPARALVGTGASSVAAAQRAAVRYAVSAEAPPSDESSIDAAGLKAAEAASGMTGGAADMTSYALAASAPASAAAAPRAAVYAVNRLAMDAAADKALAEAMGPAPTPASATISWQQIAQAPAAVAAQIAAEVAGPAAGPVSAALQSGGVSPSAVQRLVQIGYEVQSDACQGDRECQSYINACSKWGSNDCNQAASNCNAARARRRGGLARARATPQRDAAARPKRQVLGPPSWPGNNCTGNPMHGPPQWSAPYPMTPLQRAQFNCCGAIYNIVKNAPSPPLSMVAAQANARRAQTAAMQTMATKASVTAAADPISATRWVTGRRMRAAR